jgi:hypothetical protein
MDDNREQLIRTKAFYIVEWRVSRGARGCALADGDRADGSRRGTRRSGGPARHQPNHADSGTDRNAIKIGQAQGESGRRPSACSSVRPSETAEPSVRKPHRLSV